MCSHCGSTIGLSVRIRSPAKFMSESSTWSKVVSLAQVITALSAAWVSMAVCARIFTTGPQGSDFQITLSKEFTRAPFHLGDNVRLKLSMPVFRIYSGYVDSALCKMLLRSLSLLFSPTHHVPFLTFTFISNGCAALTSSHTHPLLSTMKSFSIFAATAFLATALVEGHSTVHEISVNGKSQGNGVNKYTRSRESYSYTSLHQSDDSSCSSKEPTWIGVQQWTCEGLEVHRHKVQ